jgi:aminoglycoside phosphotransferase (APT) family kinase protein
MAFVPGRVLTSHADGAGLAHVARTRVSHELIDTLADIASVDPDAVGLGDLSRRADYVPRQLRRWYRQFTRSADRELPLIDDVHAELATRVPPQRYTGLVHGDYRPGNVLVTPSGGIAAVLDWELSALGDTLADLGWMLATWHEPGTAAIYDSPTGHSGFLDRAALAERYAATTAHDVSDLPFYVAFALWRLACIHEGIRVRYRSGAMADVIDTDEQGRLVLALAEAAHDALAAY